MPTPILATKLYIPPTRSGVVLRPRLIKRLNEGFDHKLTLISAPAGFGKTTLVSAWATSCEQNELPVRVAWVSLDEEDNDPARFLTYFFAALQTVEGSIGAGALAVLQSLQPPSMETMLTSLLNEIATLQDDMVLVIDDYHLIDAPPVDRALNFLIEHLPPQLHLVIVTREDPPLPLARLRVRGHLTELRVADLRFTPAEVAEFLNEGMGLKLSPEDIAVLEMRTEGWIAGLQLAALSMQDHQDPAGFIRSFTGSHHFVMDYLVEEVLHQQPAEMQAFLLRTSMLNRLCGPLCDAVLYAAAGSGQAMLEHLEQANLFIVPLDNERRWYRYHHLFAELLRQRLYQRVNASGGDEVTVDELHIRASQWYEDHDLIVEAFHHAAASQDVEYAARMMEGDGMPLHFRGVVLPVLNWLKSLPTAVLDARPSLWVMYASALSMSGQLTGVEQNLQAAEAALHGVPLDAKTRNLIGHIAAIRALLAATQGQTETIIAESQRALEYLHPDNLPVRTATIWKLGLAHDLQGNRAAASQAYTEAISICEASGNNVINLSATIGLGNIQAAENQLFQAAQTYRRALQLMGESPLPSAYGAYLGLARLFYEWNDLAAAEQYAQQSIQLARQIEHVGQYTAFEVLLARLKLAQGDGVDADALLVEAEQSARQHNFLHQLPALAAVRVRVLLRQGRLAAAAHLAEIHDLPMSQARVYLAQGDSSAALAVLEPLLRQMETRGWQDEQLKVLMLLAVALDAYGETGEALLVLDDALALAEPGGFIRLFVDEGLPLARLLSQAAARGVMTDYTGRLLAAFDVEAWKTADPVAWPVARSLIEPLSQRELEVLQLIAQGLSNQEISDRLFLALSTVKGHNQKIFGKLQVQRRTEAIVRARELSLL